MKLKSLATIIATAGLLVAAGPSYGVACSTLTSVQDWANQGAGGCTDSDSDTLWVYNSSAGMGNLSLIGFSVGEIELAGVDFYTLSIDWTGAGGLINTLATLDFTATNTNTERFVAANFDTTISEPQGSSGASSTAEFANPAGFTLTSNDGSRDPANGETPFPGGPVSSVHVVDTWFKTSASGGAVQSGSINSFQVNVPLLVPEPASLALMGLGLAALAAIRRRGQGN